MRRCSRISGIVNPLTNILLWAIVAALLLCLATTQSAYAQIIVAGPPVDKELTPKTQAAIIDSVSTALLDTYIFLDKAQEMEKLMRSNLKKGAYKDIKSYMEFARRLTEDLRSVTHDLHLGIMYIPDQRIEEMQAQHDTGAVDFWLEEMKETNMGFRKVEILPGNIGYLDLRGFAPAEIGGSVAIAAMNFVGSCDAVIFDLRQNGGGDPSMIQLLSSYLFDRPVHLNSFYIRSLDTMQQFWSQAYVSGKRLDKAEVFVLTSPNTFSGAEEFSYNLKNLKRGTIVGKTTGGGAHPVEGQLFASLNVQANVPYGRAINPITGTNWEGVGVAPDVDVDVEKALDVAQMMALEAIAAKSTDMRKKDRLQWAAEELAARVNPVTLDESKLREYEGTYGPRKVWVENGELLYRRGENPQNQLIPLGNDKFLLKGVGYFRAQFLRGEGGNVTTFVGMYDNGTSEQHERSN